MVACYGSPGTRLVAVFVAAATVTLVGCGPSQVRDCEAILKGLAKSPSTVDFARVRHFIDSTGDRNMNVLVELDAQNSFGATVRVNAACEYFHEGSTGGWFPRDQYDELPKVTWNGREVSTLKVDRVRLETALR